VLFLQHAGDKLVEALGVLLREEPPFLMHCSFGKDRTGLVTMLLLSIMGASESDILADYSASEKGLSPVIDNVKSEMADMGMPESWALATPEAMKTALEYVNNECGGVRQYLESRGFSADEQAALRRKFGQKEDS